MPLAQSPRPLLIGERTNANGSRAFRERQAAGDVDGLVAMAREQQEEGAHVLDVCLAFVGRDEAADVAALMPRLNVEAQIPVMIDSTEPPAIEAALKRLGGRCIVNSINLEDGENRARDVLGLCRRFGAAVVALCIDEEGMAREPARKLAVARRLTTLAAEYGLGPQDLLIDPLTFTLGSGDEDSRRSALDTLAGLRLIKAGIPGARTLLGVSNVSFGLRPRVRRVLTSAFLRRALEAGLDAAILHAGKVARRGRRAGRPLGRVRPAHRRRPRGRRPARDPDGQRRRRPGGGAGRRPAGGDAPAPPDRDRAGPRGWRRIWTRRWPIANRWRSSTTCCCRPCRRSATCSARAACSCPSCCAAPRR